MAGDDAPAVTVLAINTPQLELSRLRIDHEELTGLLFCRTEDHRLVAEHLPDPVHDAVDRMAQALDTGGGSAPFHLVNQRMDMLTATEHLEIVEAALFTGAIDRFMHLGAIASSAIELVDACEWSQLAA